MNKKLRNEIREYLDSFDDDEQLSIDDLIELFYRANTLLVRVLEEEKDDVREVIPGTFDALEDLRLTPKQRKELGYE